MVDESFKANDGKYFQFHIFGIGNNSNLYAFWSDAPTSNDWDQLSSTEEVAEQAELNQLHLWHIDYQ